MSIPKHSPTLPQHLNCKVSISISSQKYPDGTQTFVCELTGLNGETVLIPQIHGPSGCVSLAIPLAILTDSTMS